MVKIYIRDCDDFQFSLQNFVSNLPPKFSVQISRQNSAGGHHREKEGVDG
jgi:hypothetical protein